MTFYQRYKKVYYTWPATTQESNNNIQEKIHLRWYKNRCTWVFTKGWRNAVKEKNVMPSEWSNFWNENVIIDS